MKHETELKIPDEVKLQDVDCPMGCQQQDENVLVGHDRLHDLPGEFNIMICQQCGLMRTNPRPTPETIGYYYPEDYGPYKGTKISSESFDDQPSIWKRLAKSLIKFNTDCIPEIKSGRLLEIGCASGSFLHKMANQGWQVEGIEFSETAAEAARSSGYSVKTGSVESVSDFDETFDLIVGWMVVEHLHQPVEALEKLAGWTKPGGWLAISVPNAKALEFKLFKDKWHALQLPTHLYHFTPETLEQLLDKSGWEMKKVFHQRVISSQVESLGYIIGEYFPGRKLHKFLTGFSERGVIWNVALYPLAWVLSLFGQTGRMTIWAQKK